MRLFKWAYCSLRLSRLFLQRRFSIYLGVGSGGAFGEGELPYVEGWFSSS